jgi:hypothetical protein
MKWLIRWVCLLFAVTSFCLAEERPSWAVTDAVDRLIATNALFLPGRDGFVETPGGTLTQYELPTKNYRKDGKDWQVELLSRRWRKKDQKSWSAWVDARPRQAAWRIGRVRVEVLASGVKASWIEGGNFLGASPPGEAAVMRQLNTPGQVNVAASGDSVNRSITNAIPPSGSSRNSASHAGRITRSPSQPWVNGLPPGMYRSVAPTSIHPADSSGSAQNVVRSPVIPNPIPATVPSASPPAVVPVSPPHLSSGQQVGTMAGASIPGNNLLSRVMPLLIGAVVISSGLSIFFKKSRRSATRRKPSAQAVPRSPMPFQTTGGVAQPPDLQVPLPPTGNPLDLIHRGDQLLTPAELAFFAVLEPILPRSYRISSKVRLADLFKVSQGLGQQAAFNKIVGKHIDFVITDSATSRILCGIELDDSSHDRPDRIERDCFVNEIFARNELPLLRVPFSWTYYPQGLREKLAEAGLSVG